MFYNSSDNFEYNDCISRGACSVSPNITSMQEIIFILLRQISYYVLNLKKLGIENKDIIYEIIFELAFIDSIRDLSETKVLEFFSKQYTNLVKMRKQYLKLCNQNNTPCKDLKNLIKFSAKTNISSILRRGDKEFLHKYRKLNFNEKYFAEILSVVIKSASINWINLYEYGVYDELTSDCILNALNIFNLTKVQSHKIKTYIDKLAKFDVELLKQIDELQTKNFGQIELTSVNTSTSPNKAIMVSGSNLYDLKTLLDDLKEDIDVYTNGNLLIAHAFPYFKKYKNLKGHFGSGVFNTILDFATFPGAILLTRNETQNIEYLYRGRLFTTDKLPAKGVVKIENNDFKPLILSSIQAKGFAKGQNRPDEIIGYDENQLNTFLDNITNKNPKKIYIIGTSNLTISKIDYFKKFFSLISDDDYAISFSYNPEKENVIHINLGNNCALLYTALQTILKKISIYSNELVFFMTKCDVNSLSNIINLKNNGAKNIFLSDCSPLVINPAVVKAFTKLYNIREITTPKEDLEKLKKEEF